MAKTQDITNLDKLLEAIEWNKLISFKNKISHLVLIYRANL